MPERNLVFIACSIACLTLLVHTGCSKIPVNRLRHRLAQQPPQLPASALRNQSAPTIKRSTNPQGEPSDSLASAATAACNHPGCNHSTSKPQLPFAEPIEFPEASLHGSSNPVLFDGETRVVNSPPLAGLRPAASSDSAANMETLLQDPMQGLEQDARDALGSGIESFSARYLQVESTSNRRRESESVAVAHVDSDPPLAQSPSKTEMPATNRARNQSLNDPSKVTAKDDNLAEVTKSESNLQLKVKPASEIQTVGFFSPTFSSTPKASPLIARIKAQSEQPSPASSTETTKIRVDQSEFDFSSQEQPPPTSQSSPNPVAKMPVAEKLTVYLSEPPHTAANDFQPIPDFKPLAAAPIQSTAAPIQAKLAPKTPAKAPAKAPAPVAMPPVSHEAKQVTYVEQPSPKIEQPSPKIEPPPVKPDALRVVNPQFCREIKGFGQVKTFPSTEYQNSQTMLLYCEVENYRSPEIATSSGQRYVTRLAGRYSIFDATGKSVQAGSFPDISDETVRKRRDFYCYFPVTLANLPAGEYRFELTLQDLADGRESAIKPALKFSVQ